MLRFSLFVIDDDKLIREAAGLSFGKNYRVTCFAAAEEALAAMESSLPDLVLLDLTLPGINGLEALKAINEQHKDVLVVVITGAVEVKTVVAAMKSGAYDYVVKPIDMGILNNTIRNALESIRMRKEVQRLQEKCLRENVPFFIGQSDAIQEVMSLVNTVAQSPDTSVLIAGDTGTGKELIASTIHFRSPNFRGPFIALNCSALPDNLVESELFGYEKGAFSGAEPGGKQGLIEAAADGTLFLDEIGDLNPSAQAKLLRFLESGEYLKVGGTRSHTIKTRVVAATNKNLESLIAAGLFRKDLYFRLAAVRIEVPDLKSRRDDILPLANYFLAKFSEKLAKPFTGISPAAAAALKAHDWQGNVRELRNLIERAVLVGKGPEVLVHDLGLSGSGWHAARGTQSPGEAQESHDGFRPLPSDGIDLPEFHKAIDAHYFRQSLQRAEGNFTRAADLLKISYFAFRRRKEKLEI